MEQAGLLSLTVSPSGTLPALELPDGVTEDFLKCTSSAGITFHILEAGYDSAREKPLILLLHGFPELAYSWRTVMPALAAGGFYVVAVDQRGHGRTIGWDDSPYEDTDLLQFSLTNLVRDMVVLVHALGYRSVRCVVGHDLGSTVAAHCALMRPDMFQSCVMMSQPFDGIPELPINVPHDRVPTHPGTQLTRGTAGTTTTKDIHFALASLPTPRKHHKWYNSFPQAADDWSSPAQGLASFLRGYFHLRSASWRRNKPRPLDSWTAEELAKMPNSYIMPLHSTMPETIAKEMEGEEMSATTSWLSDEDLQVYVEEWSRTGFQGALNHYRVVTDPAQMWDLNLFASKKLTVPCIFISGSYDWANFEDPFVLQHMPKVCSDFRGIKVVKEAGHWLQQEQPGAVVYHILNFIWILDGHYPQKKTSASSTPSVGVTAPSESPTKSGASSATSSEPDSSTFLSNVLHSRIPGTFSAIEPTFRDAMNRKNILGDDDGDDDRGLLRGDKSTARGSSVPRGREKDEPDTGPTLPDTVYVDPTKPSADNTQSKN